MALLNAGRDFIAAAIMNDGPPTFFDNTNAYFCVGDGDTAYSADQTDLQGSNKFRQGMEDGFPSVASNVISLKAIVGESDGNFVWKEWGTANASSAGTMLHRKVESLGTKTTGVWVVEYDLTVAIGS